MISYLLAFLTAVANGGSNVLNRKATQEEPGRLEFSPKLILDLLRRRTWLIAVAIMLVSFLLGATALGTGQLATVQIIIILADPGVSTAWGIAVFGEQVRGGLFLALTLIPLIVLAGSVFLLSRSPVLQATAGESPGEASEDSDGTPNEEDKGENEEDKGEQDQAARTSTGEGARQSES